jgi:YVTN family beta-propeller protein
MTVLRSSRITVFLSALLALASAQRVYAGAIPFDSFLEFGFVQIGPVTGCDPADPGGVFCVASSGTPTSFLDAPPWTFTAPAAGATLVVTDMLEAGDRFQVYDFGGLVGTTSVPIGSGDCGDDPVLCLADPNISKGSFLLGAGNHSITIFSLVDRLGSGYLQVSAVPEPSTFALLTVGLLAGLFGIGRRGNSDLRIRGRKHRAVFMLTVAGIVITGLLLFAGGRPDATAADEPVTRFVGPTSSQPLALTADDAFLIVANPDNNSVSFFDVRQNRNRRVATVPVQTEPNGVAFLPDGSKAYVANTVSGTVSVIKTNIRNGAISRPVKHIAVGTEPYGLALTPNGHKLYVTNARSNSVSVIDTLTDNVITTIQNVGPEPRGIAITNNGDANDLDETVYVTQFLSLPLSGKVDGQDDAKAAFLTRISTATDTVDGTIQINPIADTGFKATGDALQRIAPGDPNNPASFNFTTGAYPNQLNNVGIHGNYLYVPNTGASPNGPVRFDVNTQSLLSFIPRSGGAAQTINMHLAVKNQTNPAKLFITQPWAIGLKHQAGEGFVVSAASNIVVKVALDAATGTPSVQPDPSDTSRVLQIKVGKNPRGILLNSTDTRAYVMNYVSRDVSVIDLTVFPERVIATVASAALPASGSLEERIHIGKELYNTSVGEFDAAPGTSTPIVGRMSNNGWGACSACHTPFALSDNVVWIFPPGPRRTIPQNTDFDQTDATRSIMRALNWSAERDEEEDFELNIRVVSGGKGLIVLADGVTQDPNVTNFTPLASGGRNQLKVHGVGAWDAIKTFVQYGIRSPISPVSKTDPDVVAGEALFRAANCQQCHGGPQWTRSRVRYTPPPGPGLVDASGQLIGELRIVGTFDATALNEVRQNAGAPLGAAGFAPASLLSVFAYPQTFLHNGAAVTLDQVLDNVTHRSAGTSGVDTLTNAADRAKIVRFLLSIDAQTPPIP